MISHKNNRLMSKLPNGRGLAILKAAMDRRETSTESRRADSPSMTQSQSPLPYRRETSTESRRADSPSKTQSQSPLPYRRETSTESRRADSPSKTQSQSPLPYRRETSTESRRADSPSKTQSQSPLPYRRETSTESRRADSPSKTQSQSPLPYRRETSTESRRADSPSMTQSQSPLPYRRETSTESRRADSPSKTQSQSPLPYDHVDDSDADSTCSTEYPQLKPGLNIMGTGIPKKHFCVYCSLGVVKMARHLQNVHHEESEVAKAMSYDKRSRERKEAWLKLANKGDYNHNYSCKQKKSGWLVPKYRSRSGRNPDTEEYVTCSQCYGLYVKRKLWLHLKSCFCSGGSSGGSSGGMHKVHRREGVKSGKLLDPVSVEEKFFRDTILLEMNDDDVKRCVEGDPLIKEFGKRLLEKHPEAHKRCYIANKIREVGRLVLEGKKQQGWTKLEDAIDPQRFDEVICVVKSVAGFEHKTGSFEIPSLALKLGYTLSTCCTILKCRAFRESDETLTVKCKNFQELYSSEWSSRVSGHALKTLHTRRFNNPRRLPFAEDVQQLHQYLKNKAEEAVQEIENNPESGYSVLAQTCLAQIILFNRRRSGEAERVKVKEYEAALRENAIGREADEEILNCLSEFEKKLCETHVRIETTGKRGRRVPIILTEDMKRNLSVLMKHRNAAPVDSDYVFARPDSRNLYRGSDCLRQFSQKAGLKQPDLMTSTRLRQQLATHCQVLGLSENSQDILATFLGHDIRVHRHFYRLPENMLQVAKVSKVLHAINLGKLSSFKGKDFDSINFDVQEELEDEDELKSHAETETKRKGKAHDPLKSPSSCPDAAANETGVEIIQTETMNGSRKRNLRMQYNDDPSSDEEKTQATKKRKRSDDDVDFVLDEEMSQDEEVSLTSRPSTRKARKLCQKKPWTSLEVAAIQKTLGHCIQRHILPGKRDCEKAIQQDNALKDRQWKSIKYYVKNRLTAMKRSSCM